MKNLILTAIVALALTTNAFSQSLSEVFANKCIEKMGAYIDSREKSENNDNVITLVSVVNDYYDLHLIMGYVDLADKYTDVELYRNWAKDSGSIESYSCLYRINDNEMILIGYYPPDKVVYIFKDK